MPIYEYRCQGCGRVTERLIRGSATIPSSATCAHCGSEDTVKIISRVNFKTHKKPKYSEEFLGKAMPAMKSMKDTAPYFAEGGGGSDEAKMHEMGEQIGERIDRVLDTQFPKK